MDMKKFLVLYKAPQASFDKAMKASPEEAKAGMDLWLKWGEKAGKMLLDMGAPLGEAIEVTPKGASSVRNDLGGYSIMQAESSEALAKLLEGHPHFHMEGGVIEVTELVPLPAM
jgi:hypothetical protein